MKRAIVTGSLATDYTAIEWLKAHGATVEGKGDSILITLPEAAILECGGPGDWTVSFSGGGEYEYIYVIVELHVNVYETVLTLEED